MFFFQLEHFNFLFLACLFDLTFLPRLSLLLDHLLALGDLIRSLAARASTLRVVKEQHGFVSNIYSSS